jgi:hypothetical protein
MFEYFDTLRELSGTDFFFWFCALAGSGMFVIQTLLSFVIGTDHETGSEDGSDVKWLSKQAIAGFLMMFGWTALTCQHELSLSNVVTILISFSMGVITIFITGALFKAARKLHSTGAVFRLEEAIGKEAVVYHRIPKDGVGKISISLNNLTREIDAVSSEEIPSFTPVRIKQLANDNTVVVGRLL